MVNASICRPLVARSPFAASCTCCRSFWRSRISSSIVSVPTSDRRDPSSTFLTIESTCSGLASRKRSAAFRRDSTSRPILKVATPCTWTLMPWLVTASASWTLICRAVSFSLPTRLMSGKTSVPPPTTTLTPLSPGADTVWPRSSRTLEPRDPATMMASFAPATLYLLATNAISSRRMTTPATPTNGLEVRNSGIGSCSFSGNRGRWLDDQVVAGDRDHFDHASRRDRSVGRRGHVVRRAREADQNAAELVGRDRDCDPAGGADHVVEAERVARLGRGKHPESAQHDKGPDQPGGDAQAVVGEEAAHPEHGDEAEQHGRRRDTGHVESNMKEVQDPAEEVVEDQGQEEKSAPNQQAASEYEVSRVHSLSAASLQAGEQGFDQASCAGINAA